MSVLFVFLLSHKLIANQYKCHLACICSACTNKLRVTRWNYTFLLKRSFVCAFKTTSFLLTGISFYHCFPPDIPSEPEDVWDHEQDSDQPLEPPTKLLTMPKLHQFYSWWHRRQKHCILTFVLQRDMDKFREHYCYQVSSIEEWFIPVTTRIGNSSTCRLNWR